METTLRIAEVAVSETRNGNRRYVLRAEDGSEYTTFRPNVGERAVALQGRRARIEFHEDDRNGFHNVYLDALEPVEDEEGPSAPGDTDPEEVAWRTAIEAAPYLVGEGEREVDPDELFDKLKPFKDRVVDDIRSPADDDAA
jgi:hypothetical protein